MTAIQWTDKTWNPVRGCSRVSEGCRNCYAEQWAARFSGPGRYAHGFVARTRSGPRWTGRVELVEDKLVEPLRWRKPRRVFVNSMSDLFHEALPDKAIDRVFAVMALAPQHTFQVLTKRPERMREYVAMSAGARAGGWDRQDKITLRAHEFLGGALAASADQDYNLHRWPLPNVWLGVSIEDQATADERIPILLDTPAAVRFVSYEPALKPVVFRQSWRDYLEGWDTEPERDAYGSPIPVQVQTHKIGWLIVGGESGPGARPCDVAWIRSAVEQCKAAGVPCFVKQLGARVEWPARYQGACVRVHLRDRKGGDPAEWPEDLRVREFPVTP